MPDTPAAPAVVAAPNAPSVVPNVAPGKVAAPPAGAPSDVKTPVATQETDEPVFKVKVKGEMKEYKRAEAERLLSKSGYADQVVQQAKEAIKKMQARESEFEALKAKMVQFEPNSPEEEAHARKVLERKLAEATLSPEQRRIAELEAAAAERDEKFKSLEQQQRETQVTQQAKALERKMASELEAAIASVGLTASPDTLYALHAAAQEARDLGLPWDAERIAEVAKENLQGASTGLEKAVLGGLRGKALAERLGPAVVAELLRWKVEEFRGGGSKKAEATAPPIAAAPQAHMSPSDFDELMKQRRLGTK